MWIYILLLVSQIYLVHSSQCVCTTVSCPIDGNNTVIMGNGNAHIEYTYEKHGNYDVVVSAIGSITPKSLDHGTETTSCTQKYSRMLEDDGNQDCDAGHILANRLGGYGNIPTNIFPQNASVNRGSYAQFEGYIYDCMTSGASIGNLSWKFQYQNKKHTMPISVIYSVSFSDGMCYDKSEKFANSAIN